MILDDVLSLSVEDMLSRRLQTVIYKRGSAVSPMQARQLIVHRHVKIGDRVVSVPGYHVTAEDEKKIQADGRHRDTEACRTKAGSRSGRGARFSRLDGANSGRGRVIAIVRRRIPTR